MPKNPYPLKPGNPKGNIKNLRPPWKKGDPDIPKGGRPPGHHPKYYMRLWKNKLLSQFPESADDMKKLGLTASEVIGLQAIRRAMSSTWDLERILFILYGESEMNGITGGDAQWKEAMKNCTKEELKEIERLMKPVWEIVENARSRASVPKP